MPAPRPSGSGGRRRASKSRREHEGVACRVIKCGHQSDNLTMPTTIIASQNGNYRRIPVRRDLKQGQGVAGSSCAGSEEAHHLRQRRKRQRICRQDKRKAEPGGSIPQARPRETLWKLRLAKLRAGAQRVKDKKLLPCKSSRPKMPLPRDTPRQCRIAPVDQRERSSPVRQEVCCSAQPKGQLPKGRLPQVWAWKSGALRRDLLRRWTPIAHSAAARITRAAARERSVGVTTRTK
jgi:hypothetical protein